MRNSSFYMFEERARYGADRFCGHCDRVLPISDFGDMRDPYCADCMEESYQRMRSWRPRDDKRIIQILSESDLRRALSEQQGYRCAICGKLCNRLCLDHDHETGFIRGMLCGSCNNGLGQFHDNTRVLAAAIRYLQNNNLHKHGILYRSAKPETKPKKIKRA